MGGLYQQTGKREGGTRDRDNSRGAPEPAGTRHKRGVLDVGGCGKKGSQ